MCEYFGKTPRRLFASGYDDISHQTVQQRAAMLFRNPAGFTIVEVTVASALMAFLALLLSTAWIDLGWPAAALIRRGQCEQEIAMAVASLARDLGGCYPEYKDGDGHLGTKWQGRFTGWTVADNVLTLTYESGDTVRYFLQDNCLVRQKLSTAQFIAAKNVESFQVVDEPATSSVTIHLTFKFQLHQPSAQYQYIERKCTLKAKKPPLSSAP